MKTCYFLIFVQIVKALSPKSKRTLFDVEISHGIVNRKIIDGTYLETATGRQEQEIIKVEGYKVDGDEGSVSSLPNECHQNIPSTSPGNLFCINRQNGDIYATEQTTRTYVGGQTYNLTIRWTNATFRQEFATYFIQVKFKDSCESVGKSYFDLKFKKQCSSSFRPIQLISVNPIGGFKDSAVTHFTLFLGVESRMLGFKLSATSYQLLFGNTKDTFKIEVKESIAGSKTYTFEIIVGEDQNTEIFVPTYGLNDVQRNREGSDAKFNFRIIRTDKFGFQSVLLIKNNDVTIMYSFDWTDCKDLSCVNKYKTWNNSLSMATDVSCRRDESFFQIYYGKCVDLKPIFISSPSYIGDSIIGCNYNSIFDLRPFIYLLINGTKRVAGFKAEPVLTRRSTNEQLSQFTFPTFTVSNYDHAGKVQCVIFDPDRMKVPVLSNHTTVEFRAPSFTLNTLTPSAIEAGSNLRITGCSFNATFNLRRGEAIWLKDGKPYRNATILNGKFLDIDITNATLADNGEYQCFIKAGDLPRILSSRISISVTEIKIEIIRQPTIEKDKKNKSELTVSGCEYNILPGVKADTASFQPFAYYELTNSRGTFKRLPTQTTPRTTGGITNTISPYTIRGYEDFGVYKCIVYDPNRMRAPVNSSNVNTSEFLPTFTPRSPSLEPQKTTFFTGESLIMGCTVETLFTGNFTFYWTKNGERFGEDVTVAINPETHEVEPFIFGKLSLDDSGTYSCVLSDPLITPFLIESGRINITVHPIQVRFLANPILRVQSGGYYIERCDFSLSTNVKNIEESTYVLFNGTRLNRTEPVEIEIQSKRKRRMAEEGIFSIFPRFRIQSYESGFYECVVYDPNIMENPVVSNATFIKLDDEIEEPEFSEILVPLNKTVIAGKPTTLCPCSIQIPFIQPKKGEFYFLKDDTIKIPSSFLDSHDSSSFTNLPLTNTSNVNLTNPVTTTQIPPQCPNTFSIDGPRPHIIEETRFKDEGFYQCVFHPKGLQPIKSKKWFIKINVVNVKFLSKPSLSKEHGDARISGCTYLADEDFSQHSFLKFTSYDWIDSDVMIRRPKKFPAKPNPKLSPNTYYFPDHLTTSYGELEGTYECVIFDEKRMRKPAMSEKTALQSVNFGYPLFRQVKKGFNVSIGDNVTFKECKFTSLFLNGLQAIITKDEKPIKAIEITTINATTGEYEFEESVFISNADRSDTGFYQCSLKVSRLTTMHNPSKTFLDVQYVTPVFQSTPVDKFGEVLGCRYTKSKELDANFAYLELNNHIRLNFTVKNSQVESLPSLRLTTYQHSGVFRCVIFDSRKMKSAVISRNSTFIRLQDPAFQNNVNNQSINLTAGTELKLEGCSFTASRYLQFSSRELYQRKDNRKFYQDKENLQVNVTGDNNLATYSFPDILKRHVGFEDGGMYWCVLNFTGLRTPIYSRIVTVEVSEILVKVLNHPVIKTSQSGVVFGGCAFEVNEDVEGYVYIELNNSNTTKKINSTKNGSLFNKTINSFTIDSFADLGSYRCVVFDPSRMLKPVVSKESTFPSTINIQLPNITKNPESSSINSSLSVGEPYRIKGCQFKSTFQKGFDAYWLKDNKRFANAEIQQTGDKNVLLFKDLVFEELTLENNGTYSCAIDVLHNPIQFSAPISITIDEIVAEFTTAPKWKVSSDKIEVLGCKYASTINLIRYTYWLIDGIKHSISSVGDIEKRNLGNGLFEFVFPSMTITSFQKIGTYKCVIENELLQGKKIVSSVANVNELKVADVIPVFIKHPSSNHSVRTGGSLTINGCQVFSKIPLDETVKGFYLKNGIEKISILPFNSSKDISFSPHTKITSDYTDQGFYQCVLKIPGKFAKQIVSKSTDVQFIDVAAAEVTVRMDQQWNENLNNVNSKEYKALEQKVIQDMEKNLPKQNGSDAIVRVLGFSRGSVISLTQVLYTNVSIDARMKSCSTFQNFGKELRLSSDLNVNEVNSKSLDCCKDESFGEESFKGVANYSETLVSGVAVDNCTYRTSSSSRRQCVGNMKDGPKWSEKDLNDCPAKTQTTNDLIALSKVNLCSDSTTSLNCQTPVEVTGNLSEIINKPENITTRQDLSFISIILHSIALHPTAFLPNNTEAAEKVTVNILQTVSTVIASDRRVVVQAQRQTQTSVSILKSLDIIAQKLGDLVRGTNKTIQVEKPNIAFVIKYLEPGSIEIIGRENSTSETLGVGIYATEEENERLSNEKTLSSSKIPAEAFANSSRVVFSFFFRNDTLFQDAAQFKAVANGQDPTTSVASNVLAITIDKVSVTNLTKPISLKFKKTKDIQVEENVKKSHQCTFWEAGNAFTSPVTAGKWSGRGCQKVEESEDYVVCECNHLTNFAILLDVSQTGNNPLELRIITWIGCGISLAGLALTLLTYMMFKNLRQKLPPKILMSLSFSLMVLLIVFLVGVEREGVGSNEACQVVSGILHYFMLTTFMWMLVEAVNLYRNFVKIFRGGSDGKFFIKASLFAWGIPLVIVVVNGAVKPGSLGNDNFCVVHGNSFYYGLLIPVAATLLINFIVLILVMKSLTKSNESLAAGRKKSITGQARIAFACCALLGVTWVFALFAIGDLRDIFQWLFTIFNSLQGLFIFLFYTLRNQDVRKEWRRLLHMEAHRQERATNSPGQSRHLHITHHIEKKDIAGEKNEGYRQTDHDATDELDLSLTSANLIQMKEYKKESLDMNKSSFKE